MWLSNFFACVTVFTFFCLAPDDELVEEDDETEKREFDDGETQG